MVVEMSDVYVKNLHKLSKMILIAPKLRCVIAT